MKRSIMGLIYVIKGMQKAGLDLTQSLQQIGINLEQLNSEVLIERELEWQILHHLTQDCPELLGIEVGQQYSLSGYGPYFMLLMTAKNVRDALNEAIKFQDLTYLFARLSWQADGDYIHLIYHPSHPQQNDFMTQVEIAGTYKFLHDMYQLLGLNTVKIQVKLPFLLPKNQNELQIYQYYYGVDVEFECSDAIFSCEIKLLDHLLKTADAMMHEVYKKRCIEELQRLQLGDDVNLGLYTKISNYLYLQQYKIPSLQEISHVLAIPERSLRYQLNRLGTSFQNIRDEVLKQRAIILLQEKKHSIEQIALLLGYAETSSFNHAFKRWFGASPKNYPHC